MSKHITILILILIALSSCSPQKQLTRMQHKYPYLFENKGIDTLIIRETPKVDTSFVFSSSKDTTVLKDTFYYQNTIIYRHKDTLWVKSDPVKDTIRIKSDPILVPRPADTSRIDAWKALAKWVSLIMTLLIIFLWILKKNILKG